MGKASKPCSANVPGGCPHLRPCPVHPERKPWQGSDRLATLPPDWRQRRRRTLLGHPWCHCPGCPRCEPRLIAGAALVGKCARASTQADHVGDRMDHDNLRGLCDECHRFRSSQQGAAARHG